MGLIEETRVSFIGPSANDDLPLRAGGPPPPAWISVNLVMQQQVQDQWCWAAVSTSIAEHFGSTTWTQCIVVSRELDDESCCANGSAPACNRTWYLEKALSRVGALERMEDGGPVNLNQFSAEIDRGHPICIRIGWAGGGGHFVAIGGYRSDGALVAIEDPWYGASEIPVGHLNGRYQGTGRWTHTYYTRQL